MQQEQISQTEKNQEKEYSFFAFVSYCREDEKWAKWVQKKLEAYRLPSKIKRENQEIPKRIAPVFRDKTDLAGIVLEEALHQELEDSRYLIVICSPNCVKSDWVNDEIAHFCSLGGEKRIIPFAIAGTPFSDNPEEECLPAEIRKIDPVLLSIHVAEFGRREAFIRLVATMLQLRPDELLQREVVRRKKRIAGICAAGVAFSVTGASALWYNTEHSTYYSAYTTRYEIPVGINKLSSAEQKNRANSYRITQKRGRVVRLELVNAAGNVCAPTVYSDFTDYPILEYDYDSDKKLIEIQAYDMYRRPILTKLLSYGKQNQIALDFRNAENGLQATAMDSGHDYYTRYSKSIKNNEVIRQINTYDEDGYCIKSMYYRDSMGTQTQDSYYGIYGKQYFYTDDGQLQKVSFLDREENICNSKYGYAGYVLAYDDDNNMELWKYLDLQNQLCRGEHNFALQKFSYDTTGNLILYEHFSETEAPCNNYEGISVYRNRYEKGCLVSQKYMDDANQPTTNPDGIHEIKLGYDSTKRNTEINYYDVDGQPVNIKGKKYASVYMEYGRFGLVTEYSYADAEGNPCCDAETGIYVIRYQSTSDGKISSEAYFDTDGNPRCINRGYAQIRTFYNDRGFVSRNEYYDENGNLKRGVGNYAVVEYGYDAYGNNDKVQFYDEKNQPCYSNGFSGIHRIYEDGDMISECYLDAEGRPMLYKGKYHEIHDEFDENGNCVKRAFYDTEGRLTEGEDNYAYAEYAYDAFGNQIEERYFSRDNTPTHDYTYYRKAMRYDARGNMIYEEYESFSDLTFYSAECQYDAYDNLIQKTYYEKNGVLVDSDTQCAIQRFTYDAKKNVLTDELCYASGKIETRVYQYDSFGNQVFGEQFVTDAAGNKTCIAQIRQSYDEFGNLIWKEYMDGAGTLRLNDSGYAVEAYEYSPEGYVISEKYYDEQDKPMKHKNQYFCCRTERDVAGNAIKMTFYDENEELVKEADGFSAYQITEYNARGLVEYEKWLNENSQPITSADYTSMRTRYDELGNITEKIYYNAQDEMIACYVPYAFVYEVTENSQAESLGIQPGDVIIRFGDWCEFYEQQRYHFDGLKNELSRLKNSKKEILLYGNRNGTEQFIEVKADAGILGTRIVDGYLNKQKYEEIKEKYKQIYE